MHDKSSRREIYGIFVDRRVLPNPDQTKNAHRCTPSRPASGEPLYGGRPGEYVTLQALERPTKPEGAKYEKSGCGDEDGDSGYLIDAPVFFRMTRKT